jgi:CubicO group peptidase (beta-lactamase class C family)
MECIKTRLSLALTAMLLFAVLPQLVAAEDPLAGLDASIAEARELWQAPGLAAAVMKDGEVVFMDGFGTVKLGGEAEVNEHTLFKLGSTSKAFVAVSLGMLVDEGRLEWDDAVIDHLPEFRVADPYATREITIRDILSHRTGVEPVDWLWVRGFEPDVSIEQLRHAEQAASLRSAWIYNNMMYIVAGEIVEQVSGMPLQEFVQRRIFEPLGMENSVFTGADVLRTGENVAGAHLFVDGELRAVEPWSSISPLGASGVHSSVSDMSHWLQFLLHEGQVDGKRLLETGTFAELFEPQMFAADIIYPAAEEADPHFFGYGLGWFLQDYQGRLLVMHTGSLFGANALVAMVPEEELGLVIFINADPVEYRHAFMYDVIDRFLGTRERDWSRHLYDVYAELKVEEEAKYEQALAAREESTEPSLPADGYSGTYRNPLIGDADITVGEQGLLLALAPDAEFRLEHWSYDTFEAVNLLRPGFRFLLTFSIAPEGTARGYAMQDGRRFQRVLCMGNAVAGQGEHCE